MFTVSEYSRRTLERTSSYNLANRSPDQLAHAILSEEPLKPSIAITRAGDTSGGERSTTTPASIGQIREGTLDRLRRRLAGDLDNIVMKALRKEPQRRYTSVQELAEDLPRHLAGLPVTASPDTFSYRAKKFAQRNKAAVIAAAVVIITLCGATGITAWQARVARRERDKAQSRFAQVRKLANKVVFEYQDGIEKLDGATPIREKMVKDASEYLDGLAREAGGDAGLQNELAKAYQKLGDVQGGTTQANLGDREGAIVSYRKALAILKSLATTSADKPLLLNSPASTAGFFSLWKVGQQEEAEKHKRPHYA